MILIEKISRGWKRDGDWRIAPAGLAWIAEGHQIVVGNYASIGNGTSIGNYACIGNGTSIGNYACIGNGTSIGDYASIGEGARIGDYASIGNDASIGEGASIDNDASIGEGASIGDFASEVIDLGFADGYRKCIANVNGVAYIGAGCRWFTLAEAIKHWESHEQNRALTLCLMQSATHIARLKGWAFSEDEKRHYSSRADQQRRLSHVGQSTTAN